MRTEPLPSRQGNPWRNHSCLCFTLPVLLLVGCGGEERPATADPLVSDSAGVRVLTSLVPEWRLEDVTSSSTLLASFGAETDREALGEITEAVRIGDGRVFFIDFMSKELRAFVPGGGTETIARRGEGPGEVQYPVNLQRLRGDSIQVYDRRLGRITVFTPEGAPAYSVSVVSKGTRPPTRLLRVQDSLLVGVVGDPGARKVLARSAFADLGRTPEEVVLFDLHGAVVDTIAGLPGFMDIRMGSSSLMPVFGLANSFGVSSPGLIVRGSGESPSFEKVDLMGRIVSIHRLNLPPTPVRRDSLLVLMARDDRALARLGSNVDDLPFLSPDLLPSSRPAYKSLRTFNSGEVWLGSAEPFRLPSKRWEILRQDGTWRGTLGLPEDAELLDVDRDVLVLRRKDDLDVQYIEVYQLEPPAAAPGSQ